MSADEEEDETFFAGDGAVVATDGPPTDAGDGAAPAPSVDDGGKVIAFPAERTRAARRRRLLVLGLVAAVLVLLWRRSDANAA